MKQSRWALLAAGALAIAALGHAGLSARPRTSVDFYQFWAVGAARAEAGAALNPPYAAPSPTREALVRLFADEADPEILAVHRRRIAAFEPFGSPLLYTLFAALPQDYGAALAAFRVLQLLAFALGVAVLVGASGVGAPAALLGVAVLAVAYRPFGDDLFTANVNAIQLAAIALAGLAIGRLRAPVRPGAVALVLVGLLALALFKLNAVLVCAVLGACAIARLDAKEAPRALALSGAGAVLLLVLPVLYFRTPGVWLDWLRFAFLDDPRRLQAYTMAAGNTATPRLLFERLGVDPLLGAAGVALLLGLSLALVWRGEVRAHVRRLLAAPLDAAALAVVATLALWPLVWFHYFVLALVPALRLLLPADRAFSARVLGAAGLVVYSAAYLPLAVRAGVHEALPALWAASWLLLFAGWLAELGRPRETGERR